jgi:hypothetical protein
VTHERAHPMEPLGTPSPHRARGAGSRALTCAGALAALVSTSCSSSVAPFSNRAITGRVRVVANLFDVDGAPTGQRRIENADGIQVYLLGEGIADSTRTVAGQYQFTHVGPGRYVAAVGVHGVATDSTGEITVITSDVAVSDTLELASEGGMQSSPNPSSFTVSIRFTIPSDADGTLQVVNLAGTLVHTPYAGHLVAGVHIVNWDGRNGAGQLVAVGPYGVTLLAGAVRQADVIIREP